MDLDMNLVDDTLLPVTTAADRAAVGKFVPKVRPKTINLIPESSKFSNSTQIMPPIVEQVKKSNVVPFCINNLNVTQQSVNQRENSHSKAVATNGDDEVNLQCGQGERGEVVDLYNMESLDFTQPPLNKVTTVGRFQPKTKAQPKGNMLPPTSSVVGAEYAGDTSYSSSSSMPEAFSSALHLTQESCHLLEKEILHEGVSSDRTQGYGSHTSLPTDLDKSESEDTFELYSFEPLDNVLSHPSLTTARSDGKFQPKISLKVGNVEPSTPVMSHDVNKLLPSTVIPDDSLANSLPMDLAWEQEDRVENLEIGTLGVASPECTDLQLERDNCIVWNTKSSTTSQDISKEAQVLDVEPTPSILDERSTAVPIDDDGACKSSRTLRKRTNVCNPSTNGKIVDDREFDNIVPENFDEQCDGQHTGEVPKRKREPRKCKRGMTENEKPVRKRKKAPKELSTTVQEPTKKKIPHNTRRKRRQVNKELLEKPEEEIDRRQLSLKDLIMLAEAKERISIKAAALRKSNPNKSADNQFDDENQNLYGDEADRNIEESSTRLNYHSFMNRQTVRWQKPEIERFYEAIGQFGTDFAMIQKLFPDRTRHQIKMKFKNEERKHPEKVTKSLAHRSKDHSHYELVIQKLQEEAEQQNGQTAEDALQDAFAENEEESEQVDKAEAEKTDVWDGGAGGEALSPSKFEEYGGDFDWDVNAQGMEKEEAYNDY